MSIAEQAQQLQALADEVPVGQAEAIRGQLESMTQKVQGILGDTSSAQELHGQISAVSNEVGTVGRARTPAADGHRQGRIPPAVMNDQTISGQAENLRLTADAIPLTETNALCHAIETLRDQLAAILGTDNELVYQAHQLANSATEIVRALANLQARIQEVANCQHGDLPGSTLASVRSSDSPQAPRKRTPRAVIDEGKFDYAFGKVNSSKHAADRSSQIKTELSRIRIFNNTKGREIVREHLESVVRSDNNISQISDHSWGRRQVRESLLAGPGGFMKLQTVWQENSDGNLQLITLIPFGGKN
ncbi:hypothetical protein [Saccharopolyspora shandongensis]|uniref:hypothetical protein n=1 Tax=Saccharopolyspora shandongensis TaxID=418495 RepID=UPI0033FBABF9